MVPERKQDVNFAKDRNIHGENAAVEVQLKDRKRCKDLILMLGLNKTVDQMTMANSAVIF